MPVPMGSHTCTAGAQEARGELPTPGLPQWKAAAWPRAAVVGGNVVPGWPDPLIFQEKPAIWISSQF